MAKARAEPGCPAARSSGGGYASSDAGSIVAPPVSRPGSRYCPLCEARLDAEVCPADQVPTVRDDFDRVNLGDAALGRVVAGRFTVERFLGRSREEIYYIAKETLEGNLRGVLASLTPEEVNEDKQAFAGKLLDEAEHDMSRIGLVLDTLKIQNVTDEVNYLQSIGRIRGAGLNQVQAIAESEARADASVQQASNWAASETAKVEADIQIARQETAKRIAEATSRREALIQEARGEVLAQIAQVRAEIERQKARALQEKRRLDADVVQPAIARQRAAEESAKGDAASTVERGRAEAGSLKQLVEAFREGGAASRDVLALQNLMPLLPHISGAHHSLAIAKVTVLPAREAEGSDVARKAIGAAEQIRAATGVDLAGVAKKLGG